MKEYYIGIDISKLTLDVRIYSHLNNNESGNYLKVSNDLSGYSGLLRWFSSRCMEPGSIVICMEHTGIYSLDLCLFLERNNIDYSMISGYELKYSLGLVRGKSDNVDAGRIARYCYLHRDELIYVRSKSEFLLRLRELLSERRNYIKRRSFCKSYLTEFRNKPVTSTFDRCNKELLDLKSYIKSVESDILNLLKSDPELYKNYLLLLSIVGISLVNAANVILYTNNFVSFPDARSYASYCGVVPYSNQSGTSLNSSARVSKKSNRVLKSDLSQAALSAVAHDPELKLYYARKVSSGKSSGSVLNAVKFKLIERMFCVVKRGTPYVKLGGYASL